jgi:hypothetical protein
MMTPLKHIRQNQKKCKQLTGLSSVQLEKVIEQASEMDKKKKKESQEKVVNKKGAGRPKTLKTEEEICLTILYLRQMPIFEVLGMMFGVSKTTANDTFHYWLPIFEDLLPSSLLEEWKRTTGEEELMKEFLTSYQLLVDSFEQARQRPEDNEEQKKYYSGKKKQHTFKNQVIGFPKGEEIVDILVGERVPQADINLLKKQQKKLSKNQKYEGDKGYQGAERTKTPHKKPKKKELSEEQKEKNKEIAKERIYIEHLIRIIKIFRIASERFRLKSNRYKQVILVICGLVRLRIGAFKFSV